MQLALKTLPFQDVHYQPFVLHPWLKLLKLQLLYRQVLATDQVSLQ
jgi:7,8-dihydro-6-hydroxymethylpterin-pyrophosphokinase